LSFTLVRKSSTVSGRNGGIGRSATIPKVGAT
jgi:hypothetical protein